MATSARPPGRPHPAGRGVLRRRQAGPGPGAGGAAVQQPRPLERDHGRLRAGERGAVASVAERARVGPGDVVLDVGCGYGRGTIALVGDYGGARALGVEVAGRDRPLLRADVLINLSTLRPEVPAGHRLAALMTGSSSWSCAALETV